MQTVPIDKIRAEAARLAVGKLVSLADAAVLVRRGVELGLEHRFAGNERGPLRRYTDAERLERKRAAAKASRLRKRMGKPMNKWTRRDELAGLIDKEYHKFYMRIYRKEKR